MLKTIEERDKFCALYEEYKGLLYVVAYSILKDEKAAEDAVFGAFCKAAENIDKFEEPVSEQTKGYLLGIVEGKALEVVRGATEKTEGSSGDAESVLSAEEPGGGTIVGCLSRLPVRERAMLILKYGHGFTYQEIARIMGISEAAVRVLDKRAKGRLADLCAESEGDKSPSHENER